MAGFAAVGMYVLDLSTRPPSNDVEAFLMRRKEKHLVVRQEKEERTLVCLGDSLTHGKGSSNWVDRIVPQFVSTLQNKTSVVVTTTTENSNNHDKPLSLSVVNCGQNNMITEVALKERVDWVLDCQPNYVVVLLGTNDCRGLVDKGWKNQLEYMWWTQKPLSLETLETNLRGIVTKLLSTSTADGNGNSIPVLQRKVALCTLPPMSEQLNEKPNQLIRHVNKTIIAKIAQEHKDRCTLLDIYTALETKIRQESRNHDNKLPVGMVTVLGPAFAFAHCCMGYSINRLSNMIGNVVLSDGLHLNDAGGNVVCDLVVDFLTKQEEERQTTPPPPQDTAKKQQ